MRVDNTDLREAVGRALRADPDLNLCQIAVRAGWERTCRGVVQGDTTPLQRALGMKDTTTVKRGVRYRARQKTCSYETALRIADAINADPYEVGL